ncbi:MAG: RHS repeat-associated core domain-containing protein [Terriglobia bacterium]|nr:RHS repeat-associated core domain-containing protein [Terriglobia bacterium]
MESGLTANWVYDTATHGVGGLASACTGTGCTNPSNSSYFRSQTYDSFGRPSGTALTIGGTTYSYATAYNSDGRIDMVTSPSGFVSKNVYQATYGYLSQIKDSGTSAVLWTANTRDAELHLTQGTFGNSVVENQSFNPNTGLVSTIQAGPSNAVANVSYGWDTIGNLTSRTDTIEGYTERFCYDPLNRLTNYAIGATCTSSGTKTVGYDAIGNISSKTGVGTYGYPASGSSSVRPHAVTSITGTVNGVVNPTYAYDANSNMTSGGGRTITPTSFNMAASVVQGTVADCFTYDSEHNRIEMDARATSCTGTLSASTIYLNDPVSGSMEEAFVSGGSTTWRDYIATDNGFTALRSCTGAAPCTSGAAYTYVVGDHLGSTSILTDAGGTVTERDSYDAWGLRRNANGTDASSCTAITSATTRGFTDQEHMDSVCAINFNARLYDPTIARFLSADSMVPNPLNGQSFNRFSYVNNGPLSANDPSGHGCPDIDSTACKLSGSGINSPLPITPLGACTGTRLCGNDESDWYDSAALLSVGGGSGLIDYAGGGAAGGISQSTAGGHPYYWGPGSSVETPGPPPTVTVTCQCFWVSSAFALPGGFLSGSDTNTVTAGFSDLSFGGTFMIAPGVAASGSCGAHGCYGIVGAGEGYSGKINVDLPGNINGFHVQSPNYQGGWGLGANATIGLPVFGAIDSALGTSTLPYMKGIAATLAPSLNMNSAPLGLDVTVFINFSGGQLNSVVDVDLVPAGGQSAVVGLGYDARHN